MQRHESIRVGVLINNKARMGVIIPSPFPFLARAIQRKTMSYYNGY